MRLPESLTVATDNAGLPLTIARSRSRYRVLSIAEHWRITDEWWKDEVRRDYFRVETGTGPVLDIYHDTVADKWYLAGVL